MVPVLIQELQGHFLPSLHGSGYWGGRDSFFLATTVDASKPSANKETKLPLKRLRKLRDRFVYAAGQGEGGFRFHQN